ncbi:MULTISPECIES: hypothetical protein [unclassified Rickettsia]|uniref:hypothetical protein n=1 Tax=unclassified Rickettsia TaxID=114295 RepID=UPI003132D29D
MTQPFFNVRTLVGLTTVSRKTLIKRLDAVVKPALLHGSKKVPYVILAKSGNLEKSIKVILNLFQDLFQQMLKQVQHDKEKSGFPPLAITVRSYIKK